MYGLLKSTLITVKDRHILSYYGRIYNNGEVLDRIDRFASFLKREGIKKGDVVALCLPNIPEAMFAFYAVNKCGAIANLIHPLTPPLGLKKIIDNTESKLLIYLDNFFIKGEKELKGVKTVLCNVSDGMGYPMKPLAMLATHKVRAHALKLPDTIDIRKCFDQKIEFEENTVSEDIAAYLHSGGTTGSPKTIMLSNRSMNACADKTGVLVGDFSGNTDAMLMVLPMFHGFGLGVAMHTTACKGAKVVMMPRFNNKEAAKTIRKQGVTFIAGVPQMYSKLMDARAFKGEPLRKLKNIYCGGDKLPKSIKDRWDNLMQAHGNNIEILEGYGLTEMVTVTHVNIPGASKPGSVGKPLKGIKQKIIDEKGNILTAGESGEICLSGSTMMSGYLKDPESTAKAMIKDKDGINWIHTGDCGYIDSEGFLFFRERIKRMIKVSGINVFPQEIEYTVSALPEIKYSCALEINWHGRSAIKLYVVLEEGYELNDELKKKITDYIGERLMKYSVPRDIVAREKLPLTQIGKVDYTALTSEEEAKGALKY
jgi:long-chain acyl-CoA synthetase